MTFAAVLREARCIKVAAALMLSGTALKPRLLAAARIASRSRPPRRARSFAAAFVIQPLMPSAGSPACGGNEYCVPLHDDWTTCHGYVAEASVWISNAPAAPWRAAS